MGNPEAESNKDQKAPPAEAAPATPAGPGKKSKKKKAKTAAPGVLWTVKVERFFAALRAQFVEIARGTRSPDHATRRMSALFLLSVVGVIGVAVLSIRGMRTPPPPPAPKKIPGDVDVANPGGAAENPADSQSHLGEFLQKQAIEAKTKASTISLGTFTIELKPLANQKPMQGVLNMAELEIVLLCDSKNTKDYIETRMQKVQSELTSLLTAIDRDELMSREGKRKLKKRLMEKLNIWLTKGKVEDIFFAKLIIS